MVSRGVVKDICRTHVIATWNRISLVHARHTCLYGTRCVLC